MLLSKEPVIHIHTKVAVDRANRHQVVSARSTAIYNNTISRYYVPAADEAGWGQGNWGYIGYSADPVSVTNCTHYIYGILPDLQRYIIAL